MHIASLFAFASLPTALAWDNGVAVVPPLAWSSWYSLTTGNSCESEANQLTESAVLSVAENLVSTGLAAHGFRTMILDDCWQNRTRDAEGLLHGDVRAFPNGIHWLVQQLRTKDLGLGLYTTPGDFSCMKRPASLGHESQDVHLWIQEWGARYLKYCVCNTTHARRQVAYEQMQQILSSTGIAVVYEIDPAMELPMTSMDGVGHVVGAHDDVADKYSAWVAAIADLWEWGVYNGNHTRAGHWPLVDIVQTGRGGQNEEQYRSQITMYVMLCSPIVLGIDLQNKTWTDAALPLLTNTEIWGIHQDRLGQHAARVVATKDGAEVWARPLDGESFAIALWNVRGEEALDITVDLGVATSSSEPWQLRDVWSKCDLGPALGVWTAHAVPPNAVRFLKLSRTRLSTYV